MKHELLNLSKCRLHRGPSSALCYSFDYEPAQNQCVQVLVAGQCCFFFFLCLFSLGGDCSY